MSIGVALFTDMWDFADPGVGRGEGRGRGKQLCFVAREINEYLLSLFVEREMDFIF